MGSTPSIFIVAVIVFVGISKRQPHWIYLLLTLLNIALLIVLEFLFYDELIVQYQSAEIRGKDVLFGFSVSIVLSYLVLIFLKTKLKEENTIIQEQKAELQEVILTKDKFFSIIAHDLRAPFQGILGFTSIMTDKQKTHSVEKMQDFAELINKSAEDAYGLLGNLLDWARISQGLFPFNPEPVLLKPLVAKCIEENHENFAIKEISMRVDIPEAIKVYADQKMLQSIIRNLVSNAVKFTNKKGKVSVFARTIDDQKVEISVTDNGIGMSKEMVVNLFRIDVETNRKGTEGEPSSGLGLLLCKDFIAKMKGEIWVESEVNAGSSFKFILPEKA